MRVDDWQTKFWENITAACERDFEWGVHDCVMFAASSVDAILGTDYFAQAQARYPYSTEDGAIALMQQYGGITGLAESFLDPHTNWGQLGAGDIVLVSEIPLRTQMEMLCVHDGQQLIGPTARGVINIPLQYALYGWAIR